MQLFEHFPAARSRAVCLVLTDGDDTLTEGARLPSCRFRRIGAAAGWRFSGNSDRRSACRLVAT